MQKEKFQTPAPNPPSPEGINQNSNEISQIHLDVLNILMEKLGKKLALSLSLNPGMEIKFKGLTTQWRSLQEVKNSFSNPGLYLGFEWNVFSPNPFIQYLLDSLLGQEGYLSEKDLEFKISDNKLEIFQRFCFRFLDDFKEIFNEIGEIEPDLTFLSASPDQWEGYPIMLQKTGGKPNYSVNPPVMENRIIQVELGFFSDHCSDQLIFYFPYLALIAKIGSS